MGALYALYRAGCFYTINMSLLYLKQYICVALIIIAILSQTRPFQCSFSVLLCKKKRKEKKGSVCVACVANTVADVDVDTVVTALMQRARVPLLELYYGETGDANRSASSTSGEEGAFSFAPAFALASVFADFGFSSLPPLLPLTFPTTDTSFGGDFKSRRFRIFFVIFFSLRCCVGCTGVSSARRVTIPCRFGVTKESTVASAGRRFGVVSRSKVSARR